MDNDRNARGFGTDTALPADSEELHDDMNRAKEKVDAGLNEVNKRGPGKRMVTGAVIIGTTVWILLKNRRKRTGAPLKLRVAPKSERGIFK